MTTDVACPAEPSDAGLALLTGPAAGELMTAVLAAVGATPLSWRARQVDHQPGRRTTLCYTAKVRWADGAITRETLGAASGVLPAAVARISDGRTEVGMWRFPHDPDLPGLASACDPARMGRLAAGIGLADSRSPEPRLQVVAYRPRRRAVVRVDAERGSFFVKVVRPPKARALHDSHRTATAAGCPVPDGLGWTDDGLVLLAALPGRTLRAQLTGPPTVAARRADLPSFAAVVDALDRLPAALTDTPRRQTWGQRGGHYARVVGSIAPELAGRANAIAEAVNHDQPEGPDVPVHGDFYESQFMVSGGRVAGLLDIDTAGCGERLDDVACLLGHLSVLAHMQPRRSKAINEFGASLLRGFDRMLPPDALRRRTAAIVLSLATGPHRVQERGWRANTRRRIELAERWLHDAATLDPRPRRHEQSFIDWTRLPSSTAAILLVDNQLRRTTS